jgi:glycosyltransferase involved in cell wall biosynthesis
MKICLLGEYSGELDEGMRKVSSHFGEELKKQHQILTLDLRKAFSKDFWKDVKNFNPEIIHYIHGPSVRSFISLKVISFYSRDAKTIISAMHPHFTLLSERFISLFTPNLILTQSYETEAMFKKRGCKTEFLPCGVDVNRFTPTTARLKEELRKKYGINKEKFVILHVGSVKKGRNVQLLEKLQKENNQVLVVGSTSTRVEPRVYQQLRKNGCIVWIKYFKNIEEIYALSDCYLFPTSPKNKANSIEIPLSILEAMACNLPVIATKFGALLRVFEEGDGLIFVEKEEDFIATLGKIKKTNANTKTREKVLPYSWENIGKKLEEIYSNLMDGEKNEN